MTGFDKHVQRVSLTLLIVAAVLSFFPSDALAQVTEPTATYRYCGNIKVTAYEAGVPVGATVQRACFTTMAACNSAPNLWQPGSCTDQGPRGPLAFLSDIKIPSLTDLLEEAIGKVISGLAWVFFYFSSTFLTWMTFLLDYSIDTAIMSGLLGNLMVVNIGWTVVRDACNMAYIFILLYAAIKTILGMAEGSTKRMVAMVIVSAILINFSLFFTKVVIDAGNIIANSFWQRMKMTQNGVSTPSFASWAVKGGSLQSALDPKAPANLAAAGGKSFSYTELTLMYIGGGIVMLVLGYVFFAGAIMMVMRIVSLIFLMIFSPFAFLGLALPKFSYFDKWLGKLTSATFSAPVLIFLLYLITIILQGTDLYTISGSRSDTGFGCAFGNVTPACYSIFLHYIVLVGLILAALKIASDFSGGAGATASSIAKMGIGFAGGASLTAAGYLGRQTFGRIGQRIRENERLQRMAEKGGMFGKVAARTALWSGDRMARSSFDPRATKVGQKAAGMVGINFGKARGEGGADKTGTLLGGKTEEQVRELYKEAARRYPNNPELQRLWVDRKAGKIVDVKSEVAGVDSAGNPIYTKTRKRVKASETAFGKKLDKEIRDKIEADRQKENLNVVHQVHKNPASVDPAIRVNMQRNLGVMTEAFVRGAKPSVVADLSEEMLVNPHFISSYTPAQLRAIAANDKVSDDSLRAIKAGILGRPVGPAGFDPAREWLENIIRRNPDSRWATV